MRTPKMPPPFRGIQIPYSYPFPHSRSSSLASITLGGLTSSGSSSPRSSPRSSPPSSLSSSSSLYSSGYSSPPSYFGRYPHHASRSTITPSFILLPVSIFFLLLGALLSQNSNPSPWVISIPTSASYPGDSTGSPQLRPLLLQYQQGQPPPPPIPPKLSSISNSPPQFGCQDQRVELSHPREKGCILILVRDKEEDLKKLVGTLRNFEEVFNREWRYPYVFLTDPVSSRVGKDDGSRRVDDEEGESGVASLKGAVGGKEDKREGGGGGGVLDWLLSVFKSPNSKGPRTDLDPSSPIPSSISSQNSSSNRLPTDSDAEVQGDEGGFTSSTITLIKSLIHPSTNVEFGLIDKSEWAIPDWLDKKRVREAIRRQEEEGILYGGMESYHHMCRFFSGFFANHPLLQKYDFYWRVEPDIRFYNKITYDPIRLLSQRNLVYGFVITLPESRETVPSLYREFEKFGRERGMLDKHGRRIAGSEGGSELEELGVLSESYGSDPHPLSDLDFVSDAESDVAGRDGSGLGRRWRSYFGRSGYEGKRLWDFFLRNVTWEDEEMKWKEWDREKREKSEKFWRGVSSWFGFGYGGAEGLGLVRAGNGQSDEGVGGRSGVVRTKQVGKEDGGDMDVLGVTDGHATDDGGEAGIAASDWKVGKGEVGGAEPDVPKGGRKKWKRKKEPGEVYGLTGKDYNMCHFWTNFEIGDLRFFRSREYQELFHHLDRAGGFFFERWGDAPIRSLALGLLTDIDKVHYFEDFAYLHDYFLHCPAQEGMGCNLTCTPPKEWEKDKITGKRVFNIDSEGDVKCLARWKEIDVRFSG